MEEDGQCCVTHYISQSGGRVERNARKAFRGLEDNCGEKRRSESGQIRDAPMPKKGKSKLYSRSALRDMCEDRQIEVCASEVAFVSWVVLVGVDFDSGAPSIWRCLVLLPPLGRTRNTFKMFAQIKSFSGQSKQNCLALANTVAL